MHSKAKPLRLLLKLATGCVSLKRRIGGFCRVAVTSSCLVQDVTKNHLVDLGNRLRYIKVCLCQSACIMCCECNLHFVVGNLYIWMMSCRLSRLHQLIDKLNCLDKILECAGNLHLGVFNSPT